jgi:hypothetical protein
MIIYRRFFYFFALSLLVLATSCVSDIDTDRVDEIVLSPRVDADLVFFTISASDFETANTNTAQLVVRDTTRLEFLDDNVVQENLKEIELTYRSDNTFDSALINRSLFLDNTGAIQYEVNFPISASQNGEVATTRYQVILSEEDIEAIRNSIQLVNEVTLFTNGVVNEGVLTLQSKAIYSLELSDL